MSDARRRCNNVNLVHEEPQGPGRHFLAGVKTSASQSRCTERLLAPTMYPTCAQESEELETGGSW